MHSIEDRDEDVVELGVASIETKGGGSQSLDTFFQQTLPTGIADD